MHICDNFSVEMYICRKKCEIFQAKKKMMTEKKKIVYQP